MTTFATPEPVQTPPQVVEIRRPSPWNLRSVALIVLLWLILQLGGIFSPGLLDDVDSIYIEVAREMLQRHDFVTPFVDGVRFFDKPPLMYWMASGSMSLFGQSDWAARLPLALAVLALLLSTYALGNHLFSRVSEASVSSKVVERGGLYSSLVLATAIGPYLYTRFFIPDILICLWMTFGVHLFLIALERVPRQVAAEGNTASVASSSQISLRRSPLLPCLAFAAVLALNLLTKGLIGVLFPLAFVLLYLAVTRQLRLLRRFQLLASTAVFLAIAAPWHVLAALRNPAIALPSGIGLPSRGGWAWFYLYNEHIARFLSRRVPHDYGQTPVWLFWLYLAIWIMPWAGFLPSAIRTHFSTLRHGKGGRGLRTVREHETALTLLLWSLLVMGFFTLSSRQEYYSLPAIPAFALMAGGFLARADSSGAEKIRALRWSVMLLAPVATATAGICVWFAITAPGPAREATLSTLLANHPGLYNLSLGHLFDLTGPALGFFRGPLAAVAVGLLAVGPGSTVLRWRRRPYAANLLIAAGMTVTLLAAHAGLSRFNPILGSKGLAQAIDVVLQPDDLIVLDGELTTGSSILFYTRHTVHVVDGRVNTLWYGSFWPDAPPIFETEASLHALWSGPRHVFLMTSSATRERDLSSLGTTSVLATSGGKTVLTNFTR